MIVTATQWMKESADEFLAHYSSSRFSERTVELYGMILHRFLEFMRENVTDPEITRNDARLFLAGISQTNNPISTNQSTRYLAVMRIFFNWMIVRGLYTDSNNFIDIPNAKEPDLLPVFLVANERARLYQLVEEDPKIKVKDVIIPELSLEIKTQRSLD